MLSGEAQGQQVYEIRNVDNLVDLAGYIVVLGRLVVVSRHIADRGVCCKLALDEVEKFLSPPVEQKIFLTKC